MNRATLTLIACLCAANTAVAQKTLEVLEGAGEYLLSQIDLPSGDNGSLALKACASCETDYHRVTPATKYIVNGSQLTLVDFKAVVDEMRNDNVDDQTMVGLFVDRASHNVTRIMLVNPPK